MAEIKTQKTLNRWQNNDEPRNFVELPSNNFFLDYFLKWNTNPEMTGPVRKLKRFVLGFKSQYQYLNDFYLSSKFITGLKDSDWGENEGKKCFHYMHSRTDDRITDRPVVPPIWT